MGLALALRTRTELNVEVILVVLGQGYIVWVTMAVVVEDLRTTVGGKLGLKLQGQVLSYHPSSLHPPPQLTCLFVLI